MTLSRADDLRPVELADQDSFRPYFASLLEPLSDYTFSQIYTWRNSLHIVWKIINDHLCVFANGTGDLTLLIPPIGETGSNQALKQAFELMDDYNARQGVPERTRVEYASEELLARLDRSTLHLSPMGTDYVYDVRRMIDLAGGDLASKRQAKNRFMRLYPYRVETYDASKHLERLPCPAGRLARASGCPAFGRAQRELHQTAEGNHRDSVGTAQRK